MFNFSTIIAALPQRTTKSVAVQASYLDIAPGKIE